MGRITEIIAAVNREMELNKENFFHLDVTDERIRESIISARKQLKKNLKKSQKTFDFCQEYG